MKRFLLSGVTVVAGVLLGVQQWLDDQRVIAIIVVLVAGALGWWFYRLLRPGPHVALAEVPAKDVVVFWKPGCIYCVRLLNRFDAEPGISWVNIHRDAAAAAVVREHNDGNELTPTVRTTGGQMLSNPSPDEVAGLLVG